MEMTAIVAQIKMPAFAGIFIDARAYVSRSRLPYRQSLLR